MLYTYNELLIECETQYNVRKMLAEERIFRIAEKIYSDKKSVSKLAILSKSYPDAIFTMNSAYYYHSLTDDIPTCFYMVSKRNGTKIKDEQVVQTFEIMDTFGMGKEKMVVRDATINIYSKERMLIELVLKKNKMPFDYYKELISSYRKSVDELDISKIEEYAMKMYRGDYILDTLQMEVF